MAAVRPTAPTSATSPTSSSPSSPSKATGPQLSCGEDLGTVEDTARNALAEHDILSYRLLWFEHGDPATWPSKAMAAVTTHDLPTVAGLWDGTDLETQRGLGLDPATDATEAIRSRLAEAGDLRPTATAAEAVVAAHELLSRAPAMFLLPRRSTTPSPKPTAQHPRYRRSTPQLSPALPSDSTNRVTPAGGQAGVGTRAGDQRARGRRANPIRAGTPVMHPVFSRAFRWHVQWHDSAGATLVARPR